MRVLFSATPGDGHFLPLVPLAQAAERAGHDVAFAVAPDYVERANAFGLTAFPVGLTLGELEQRYEPVQQGLNLESVPIAERRPLVFTARFAELEAPNRIDGVRALVRSWQPDIVVHESCELAAPAVAEEHGLPSVHHSFGRTVPERVLRFAAERVGTDPDALLGAYRGTYVDVCPPSLQGERPPAGARTQPLRPAEGSRGERAPRPLVYATLGTAALFTRAERYRNLLEAFAPLECDVLLTVGSRLDPASLEPVPVNARVAGYIPQAEILPRADVVVAHGGSGSTFGALAHGCPLLCLPAGADQFENAAACAEAGAAIALLPHEQTVDRLREALRELLTDPSYAEAAQMVAAEIAAMPSADQAAAALFAA